MSSVFANQSQPGRRFGASMIVAVIAMTAIVAIISFGIDYGRVQLVKSQLQDAADAAARFAATGLRDGTAVSNAMSAAADNYADGSPVVLLGSDIETGAWDSDSRTFTPGGSPTNAVRVTAQRTSSRGNAVPLTFARVIGQDTCDVRASSVARMLSAGGHGIVGLNHIDFNSNIRTDSYNASAGPYNAATAGTKGYIASNGSISLNGATISLDVHMLTGKTLSSSSSSYGSRVTMASAISVATPSAGSVAGSNNNSNITPSGAISGTNFNGSGNVTLPGGNYYFTSFNANSATLNFTGPATIYLNGNADLNSTTVKTHNNLPSNLTIKVVKTSGSPLFKLNSVNSLYADIQAPTADIDFNSVNAFYGRMIGKTITMNSNTFIHHDVSLPEIDGLSADGSSGAIVLVE